MTDEPPWEEMIARALAGEAVIDIAREHNVDARSLHLRVQHRIPRFAEATKKRSASVFRRLWRDPKYNPIVLLTPNEKADYDILTKSGMKRRDALISIGREDILPLLEKSGLMRPNRRGNQS